MSSFFRFKAPVVAALVPVVLACELLLPRPGALPWGVSEALACSGDASGAAAPRPSGWTWLKPSLAFGQNAAAQAVPVATDGFFVIDAEGSLLGVDAATNSMQVVVTDESGATVAGETKLLLHKQEGWYLFGWSATSPLAVGSKLQATLSATPVAPGSSGDVGGQFPLVVAGEPTPLPTPKFGFSTWLDFFHGEGPVLSCLSTPATTCTPMTTTLSVPAMLTKQAAAEVTWQPPAITSGVAWSARLEASSSHADAKVANVFAADYLGGAGAEAGLMLGRVVFPTAAASYCATLVLTDLRTKQETRAETCAAPQMANRADTDTSLGACDEPPSATLREAWCRLKGDSSSEPACASNAGNMGTAGFPSAGAGHMIDNDLVGGTGGAKTSGSAGSAGSATPTAGAVPTNDAEPSDDPAGARTSQGCQVGGSAPGPASFAGLSMLALAWLARRRS